jgi:SAM-dependent methyltransferase
METSFYRQYGELERSHWWFAGRRAIVARAVSFGLREAAAAPRILEVGCGTGGMLRLMSAYGKVYGVDLSDIALAQAREEGSTAVARGNACSLPFADDTFSIVSAFDMLEHVPDDRAALGELHRVCARGGRLIVSVPAFPFLWGRQDVVSHHYRRYVKTELVARLRAAGFRGEYTTYFNTWLFPAIAAIRTVRRLRPAGDAPPAESDFDLQVPNAVNALLRRVLASEAAVIGRVSLPVGVSLLSVATKG